MRTIAAGQFKTNCLAIMDEVQQKRESVLITKRGRPVARLIPAGDEVKDQLIGSLKGKIRTNGDIIRPALDLNEWEMER